MKKLFWLMVVGFSVAAETVPFLPFIAPPPPSEPVFPESYSNNLELVQESVKLVTFTTNLFATCWYSEEIKRLNDLGDTNGVETVRAQWRDDRDALVMSWVEACRTNGLPVWTNGVPMWTNGIPVIVVP